MVFACNGLSINSLLVIPVKELRIRDETSVGGEHGEVLLVPALPCGLVVHGRSVLCGSVAEAVCDGDSVGPITA